jgi:hypothetical protein
MLQRDRSSAGPPQRGRAVSARGFAILAALVLSLLASSPAGAARSEFYGIAQGPPFDNQDLAGLTAARVHTVRFLLFWKNAEPSQGSFRWGPTDRVVGQLASRGVRPVPFVWGSPPWVASTTARPPLATLSARQAWQDFLKRAVARYGPGGTYWSNAYSQQFPGATPLPVQSWQAWNEPNLPKYFDVGTATAQERANKYAQLLQLFHDAIKAKDPGAQILLAGLVPHATPKAWDFLNLLYAVSGFKGDFDIAALHPYSRNLDEFQFALEQFRSVMKNHNDAQTPLWITEFGWGSAPADGYHNVGLTGQKQILSDSVKLVLKRRSAWNVQRLFWFTWRDPAAGSSLATQCSICGSAGLLRYDRTPKPSYYAFKGFSADTTAPTASITSGPGGFTNDPTPSYSFASSEDGSTFACRVDGGSFKPCSSPYTLPTLSDGGHAFYVKAMDAAGNESAAVSRSFTVDTKPPTVTPPIQSLSLHTQLGGTTVPVRLGWSGSDDRTSQSNLKFDLKKRTYQSGSWGAWSSVLANTSLRATTPGLDPGTTYQFGVLSEDQAGNASAFKVGAGFTPQVLQESAASYTGTWNTEAQSDASGGSVKTSNQAGATATFAFTGRNLAVVMPLRSTLGSVKICLDPGTASQSCATVDLSPASGLGARMIVFSRNALSTAVQHHVAITLLSGRAALDALAGLR